MNFSSFDMFSFKAGIYHRLFLYCLPISLIIFFGLNLKLLGSLIFILGIPLFWNLRNKEVNKFPDSILDIDD